MTAFICITCGSLVICNVDDRILLHPTNVVCSSRTNLQNGTLRLRRYLELSAKINIDGNPSIVVP